MIKSYPSRATTAAASGGGTATGQTVAVTRVSELSNDKGYLTADDLPEELDPHVSEWARQEQKPIYTAEEVGALPATTDIPDELKDLQEDSGHRSVSDAEKEKWNAKQDAISDLQTIRSGAAAGATAYQKPNGGIPKTDLASAVQSSLSKADSALQQHQDISGKADVAALAGYTPTKNFATINGASITGGGNIVIVAAEGGTVTYDAVPTSGSENPVQSGGVYAALEGEFFC